MKKVAKKKVAKKTAKKKDLIDFDKVIQDSKKVEDKKEYSLTIKLNDQVFEIETNDLFNSIMSVKPTSIKTRIVFKVEKDGKICERVVFVPQGRLMFARKIWLETFIRRFIFK